MDKLKAGTVVTLDVSHEAPFGYFLTDGKEEILLHENDITGPVDEQATLHVFLYQDHRGRMAATMRIPTVRLDACDWAKVASVQGRYGVFINIGISKDMLLSKDDLPDDRRDWPREGDRLYCNLKLDKKDRLFANLADEDTIAAMSAAAPSSAMNKETTATVYHLLHEGARVLTADGWLGFIHHSEQTEPLRLGQEANVRVIAVKEDGTVNLSMRPKIFKRIDNDADTILRYMESRDGMMPYSDQSLPEDIRKRFSISKSDFKKALGKLMKEGKLYQQNGWSYLKQKEN
ncbi:MAG: S1-like domain-containing RNA-binding protein [Sporolactobacillus sp.]|jgi:predicted RNA-binding protein (virulence factor B family)|nr:S1-like domain-containing RNA-binding protein [Sporolactobacillus sp.]